MAQCLHCAITVAIASQLLRTVVRRIEAVVGLNVQGLADVGAIQPSSQSVARACIVIECSKTAALLWKIVRGHDEFSGMDGQ